MNTEIIMNFSNSEITISDNFYQRKKNQRNSTTFVTGSSVAACEKATSVSDPGSGLEATSAAKVRL